MSNHLFTSDAEGVTRPATADEILDAARAILARRIRRGAAISSPRATREFLKLQLADHGHEVFAILFLDNRHRLIEFVPLFRGTIDGASVYPREVVKEALSRSAAAVIIKSICTFPRERLARVCPAIPGHEMDRRCPSRPEVATAELRCPEKSEPRRAAGARLDTAGHATREVTCQA